MAKKYRLSIEAVSDLEQLLAYVASERPRAAKKIATKLIATMRDIARHPEIGRLRDELAPNLRSIAVENYILFYRARSGYVEIARVLHGARDVAKVLEDESVK